MVTFRRPVLFDTYGRLAYPHYLSRDIDIFQIDIGGINLVDNANFFLLFSHIMGWVPISRSKGPVLAAEKGCCTDLSHILTPGFSQSFSRQDAKLLLNLTATGVDVKPFPKTEDWNRIQETLTDDANITDSLRRTVA